MMPTLDELRVILVLISMAFALLSFGLYFFQGLNWLKPKAQEKAADAASRTIEKVPAFTNPASVGEVAELAKALASLTESLAKAGPALWSLIGSVLFLLIAALASGVIVGAPEGGGGNVQAETTAQNGSAGDAGGATRDVPLPIANENIPVPPRR